MTKSLSKENQQRGRKVQRELFNSGLEVRPHFYILLTLTNNFRNLSPSVGPPSVTGTPDSRFRTVVNETHYQRRTVHPIFSGRPLHPL